MPMTRDHLTNIVDLLGKIRDTGVLDPLPHWAAKKIESVCKETIDIAVEAFGATEIMGTCDHCEKILLDTDKTETDLSGDCTFCADCVEAWKAERKKKQ